MRRPIKRVFAARLLYAMMLIAAQVILLFYSFSQITVFWPVQAALSVLSAVLAFWLVAKYENETYKLTWIIIILLLPVFGMLIYLLFGNKAAGKPLLKWVRRVTYRGEISPIEQTKEVLDALEKKDMSAARIAEYIVNVGKLPLHSNTETMFLRTGEQWYEKLKQELEKAEKYIFMEFFIIEEGEMWNSILDILVKKAMNGVDVRVLYDDVGCIKTLPKKYDSYLRSLNIRCHIFNRLVPVLSIRHNNRDHRKICVIDGKTAFTGGCNIADEYINKKRKFGHWLDNGIMLKGPAVKNMLAMFLATWDFLENKKEVNITKYIDSEEKYDCKGYVLPYADNPFTGGDLAANVYLHIISRAKKYVYITTPYLIIDFAMEQALVTAAQSGVDVRILFPGIPDKLITYELSQSIFPKLVSSGVKIYLYTPGFVHSKIFVSDDDTAVVGTINLDYRSLYLHFENAVFMYGTDSVSDVKNDFVSILNFCHLVTEEETKNISLFKKAMRAVFLPFAPLV